MVGVIVIVLKFVVAVSYSVDVPSDVDVDLFMDVLSGVMIRVWRGIGIDVLAAVSESAFAVIMTALEFPVPTPSGEFSR